MKKQNEINKFMFFGHNYNSNFISKVYGDKSVMGNHLQNKFSNLYEKYSTLTFFIWYMELDDTNKELLQNYIKTKYKG